MGRTHVRGLRSHRSFRSPARPLNPQDGLRVSAITERLRASIVARVAVASWPWPVLAARHRKPSVTSASSAA